MRAMGSWWIEAEGSSMRMGPRRRSHVDGRLLEGVCLELPRQARRRAPGTEQIWRGEVEQRQAGGVGILLAALAWCLPPAQSRGCRGSRGRQQGLPMQGRYGMAGRREIGWI